MKKQIAVGILAALLGACGDVPTQVYLEQPSDNGLAGAWSGIEEITTDNDITSNINFPGTTAGGFSFPVVILFDGHGQFTLLTSNYPTSYQNEEDRSCRGVYTRSGSSLSLYPASQCRALPMYKYVLGRTLPDGITLEARTNTSGDPMASYASVHVRFNLTPE
jgi:hypothetical protein